MTYNQPQVVGELCANHMGNLELAKRMVRMCEICGVHVVKLQKRDIDTQAERKPALYNGPHPNPRNSFGPTYRAHREALEFSIEQHIELKQYIEDNGMVYSTSVWDVPSARQIIELKPKLIKAPSACNNDFPMLTLLRDKYEGDIHVSLGMTTLKEFCDLLTFFAGHLENRLVFYHCTSGYPIKAEEAYLLEISRLAQYPNKAIGFSNHHSGISLDMSAQALGATWFEHHVTVDRMLKGTDHIAALEFEGVRKLVRDLNEGYAALRRKPEEITDIEKPQRAKLKYQGE